MSRIPLVEKSDASGEVAETFDALEANFGKIPNLFKTLARFPPAMRPMWKLFDALYNKSDLDPRMLELVIIQVAYSYQSHYCLTIHKAFALERGLSNQEIKSMMDPATWSRFPESEQALLAYVAAYEEDSNKIPDEVFDAMRAHYTESQIVNLTMLMGLACLYGQTANALQIPIDSFIGASATS